MKTLRIMPVIMLFMFFIICPLTGKPEVKNDHVQALKDLLTELKNKAGNSLFSTHFESMLNVIEAKGTLTKADSSLLTATLPCFTDEYVAGNASLNESYLSRQRQLVISWVSPTDGKTSFFRLRLPKDWDPDKLYPLYIELHGLWGVADNPLDFMTYSFRQGASSSISFEDGYLILPWGRGNFWYQGISETDIWEGINYIESILQIDQSRKYLTGHSMGGYGAWSIASKSANTWAAIGIHAGALWYGSDYMLSEDKIQNLSNTPTYFVCGYNDGLYDINLDAYNLLKDAGNQNVEFVSFSGGHEYLSENVKNMYLWLKDFENENFDGISPSMVNDKQFITISSDHGSSITTFKLHLSRQETVKLLIYDLKGRVVDTLVDKTLSGGDTNITWGHRSLSPGIYFYSMITTGNKLNGKILVN